MDSHNLECSCFFLFFSVREKGRSLMYRGQSAASGKIGMVGFMGMSSHTGSHSQKNFVFGLIFLS